MKNIIRLEELALFGLCVYTLTIFHAAWWWYVLIVCGPDISMLGFLADNKTGALCYNVFHHKGIAAAVFFVGLLLPDTLLQMTGMVLFGHSSLDRFFGYGLKTNEGFKYTHLGMIGKKM